MFQLDMLKPGMNSTEPPHPENLKDCVEFLRTVLTFSQKEYVGIAEAERQVLIDFTLPSLINNNLIEKIYAIDPSMEDIVRKAME